MNSGGTGGSFRKWRLPWLMLVVTVSLGIFLVLKRGSAPREGIQPPLERSRNDLVLRDGRLFDGEMPFTGLVLEHYDGGALKSCSTVVNGLLEGLSEGRHTNGALQVTEYFVRGVAQGTRTKYHPNGNKLSTATIVDGKIQGHYERWYDDGTQAEQIRLTNGIAHGESFAFYPDGSLKARVHLDQGTVIEQKFFQPGEVRATALR